MSSPSATGTETAASSTDSVASPSTSTTPTTSTTSLGPSSASPSSSSSPPLTTSPTSPADPPSSTSGTTPPTDTSTTTNPPTSPPPDTTTTTTPPDTSTTLPPDTSTTTSNPPTNTNTDTGGTTAPTATETGTGTGTETATATSPSSDSSPASSASQTTTSALPTTSTQTSTVLTTAPDGSVHTSYLYSTIVSTPTIGASDRSSSSSSHTGAIVGGVVGGVGGAAILATILFFLFRARRRRDDFDGNFDPDRVTGDAHGTLPDIDLGADEITPYNYNPPGVGGAPASGPAPGPGMPDMRQYGGQVPSFLAGGVAGAGAAAGAGALAAGKDARASSPPSAYTQPSQSYYAPSSSEHGYPDYAAYANPYPPQGGSVSPPGSPTNTAPGAANVPGRDFRHPSPGPSLAATTLTDPSVSNSGSSQPYGAGGVLPSAKEREAAQYRRAGGLAVANPDTAGAGGSGVVQHQDAGRLDGTPEDEEPSEIPPRYDSIRHD